MPAVRIGTSHDSTPACKQAKRSEYWRQMEPVRFALVEPMTRAAAGINEGIEVTLATGERLRIGGAPTRPRCAWCWRRCGHDAVAGERAGVLVPDRVRHAAEFRRLAHAGAGASQLDVFAGHLYVFANKRRDRVKPQPGDPDGTPPEPPAVPPAKGRGRPPLAKELPREIRTHEVAGKDEPCAACGEALRPLPPDTSERLRYIPAQDVCHKYACGCQIHTATKPGQPLPKSNADPSLLAQVVVAKYGHHLPLNRQEQMWASLGVELSRQTMGGWVAQVALLLDPVYVRATEAACVCLEGGARRLSCRISARILLGSRWPPARPANPTKRADRKPSTGPKSES